MEVFNATCSSRVKPIPPYIPPNEVGVQHSISALTENGVEKELLSHTVASGKYRKLLNFKISCRETGLYRIYLNSDIIGSGRLNSTQVQDQFTWNPPMVVDEGYSYRVTYITFGGRPDKSVEAYRSVIEVDV